MWTRQSYKELCRYKLYFLTLKDNKSSLLFPQLCIYEITDILFSSCNQIAAYTWQSYRKAVGVPGEAHSELCSSDRTAAFPRSWVLSEVVVATQLICTLVVSRHPESFSSVMLMSHYVKHNFPRLLWSKQLFKMLQNPKPVWVFTRNFLNSSPAFMWTVACWGLRKGFAAVKEVFCMVCYFWP